MGKFFTAILQKQIYIMNKKILGIALVLIGGLMIAYTGFNFVTKEKVIDVGPIEVSKDNNHSVQWSPIIGAGVLIGGIIVLALDSKSRS